MVPDREDGDIVPVDFGGLLVGGCAGCAATFAAFVSGLAVLGSFAGRPGGWGVGGVGTAVGLGALVVAARLWRAGHRGIVVGLALGALLVGLLAGPGFALLNSIGDALGQD